jgi:outer membrane immunogenic protein
MRRTLLSAASLLAAGAPVSAADIAVPDRAPAAIAAPFSWTGVYLGAHGGGGWSKITGRDPTVPGDPWTSVNASGAIAGAQVGGNYQIGNIVLGLEGSYAWSNVGLKQTTPLGGPAVLTVSIKNDYVATAAGRIGYAFDRVLLYAKGGGAFTRDKLDATDGIGGTATGRFSRTGWMAGGGVEVAIWQNWSVKAEYDYLRFGQVNEVLTTTGTLTVSPAVVRLDMQLALIGLNYRF